MTNHTEVALDAIIANPKPGLMTKFSFQVRTSGYECELGGWVSDSSCDHYMEEIDGFKLDLEEKGLALSIPDSLYGKSHYHFHPERYAFYVQAKDVSPIIEYFSEKLQGRMNNPYCHGSFMTVHKNNAVEFASENCNDLISSVYRTLLKRRFGKKDVIALNNIAYTTAFQYTYEAQHLDAKMTHESTEVIHILEGEFKKEWQKIFNSELNRLENKESFIPLSQSMFYKLSSGTKESLFSKFPFLKDIYKKS